MKKNKNIFMASVLLLSLGLASCTDSFLDVTSKTESSTGTFYKTEKDAYRALIGCYDGWRQTSSAMMVGFYMASEVMSAERPEGAATSARRGPQDGQCGAGRVVWPSHAGGRYPRLSREPPPGSRARERRHAAQGGGLPHGPHPRGGRGRRPPLAAAPRTLRLPERAAEMRGMSIRRLLPETDEG